MSESSQTKRNTATGYKSEARVQEEGKTAKGRRCKNCGAAVSMTAELCPVCMHPLNDTYCSFCGAPLFPGDKFCPECGSSVVGVTCPTCGTLCFRNFCSHCMQPVTEAGRAELARAQADPAYQKMQRLAKELAEMEELLLSEEGAKVQEGNAPQTEALSEEDLALINKYKDMISVFSQQEVNPQTEVNLQAEAEPKPKIFSRKQIMEEYKAKVQEINDILASFKPDDDATPQMQRDYYSARKVCFTTKTVEIVKTGWICNYCGCLHSIPSECAEPWHGGKWICEPVETVTEEWRYEE